MALPSSPRSRAPGGTGPSLRPLLDQLFFWVGGSNATEGLVTSNDNIGDIDILETDWKHSIACPSRIFVHVS